MRRWKLALRRFRRNPAFTLAVTVSLALGLVLLAIGVIVGLPLRN